MSNNKEVDGTYVIWYHLFEKSCEEFYEKCSQYVK